MDKATGGYREKYRRAIEDQERMEKQFKFQLDALKKTLLHVSAATQGLDKQLDASLILLKEKMRGATGQKVLEQMERVQRAADDYQHSRRSMSLNSTKQVTGMIDQLADLKIPTTLKSSLESFNKGLKKRLDSQRNYPDVLTEFRKLQDLALSAAANPPTSLWQRLKGGTTLKPPKEESAPPPSKQEAANAGLEGIPAEFEEVDMEIAPQEGELIQAGATEKGIIGDNFDPGDEDNYFKVANRIARTLENLVERIEPNDVVRHKIDIVRLRIQRGMDWFVLAVTLEDIRDILLLRYLQNDQEFSDYLKRVNEELQAISKALGLATEADQNQRQISENLSSAMSEEVDRMRDNMENSKTIDDLKLAVTDHLTVIQEALGEYKTKQMSQASLTEQLKSLIGKVESIESDSQKTKELLEEERHRATHDPLTTLPNREAYNERAFHELQRFKRYSRPLTLAVCDIDHFKKINDNYGHQAGDKVLQLIAKLIATRLRKVDFVARYGGEEFVILMPETTTKQGLAVLDKVRAVMAKTPFKFKGDPVSITMSFGLADCNDGDSIESVFERADKALYKAKDTGRNRCVIAEQGEPDTT